MYKYRKATPTSLQVTNWTEGETIETKLRRIIANKEQVKDMVELNYSDTNAGVGAGFNIRTDKFEVAIKALDRNTKAAAVQAQTIGQIAKEGMQKEEASSKDEGKSQGEAQATNS